MPDPSAATHLDDEVREALRWSDADRVACIDRDLEDVDEVKDKVLLSLNIERKSDVAAWGALLTVSQLLTRSSSISTRRSPRCNRTSRTCEQRS